MHKEDVNGFWIYENTPLTKEGVFPYRGRQIDTDGSMGLDPKALYMVYRPAKELTNKETLESFNGIQFTDEHEMLGRGQRDVGTKRMDGTIYNVHVSPYQPGVVLCTLKVMSEAAKNLIQQGKRQLSCGYYCDYVPENGVWNGQPYQFVQKDVIGNHVALVRKGRMGEQVSVCDSADVDIQRLANYGRQGSQVRVRGRKTLTCDSAMDINREEIKFMPTEKKTPEQMLQEALTSLGVTSPDLINQIVDFIQKLPANGAPGAAAPDQGPAKDTADVTTQDPAPAPAPADQPDPAAPQPQDPVSDGDADPQPAAPAAAADPTQKPMTVTPDQFAAAVDCAMKEQYAKEDAGRQLAEDIAPLKCGNLWKRGMDEADVAEAACAKMGHADLPKEAKIPFVKAMAAEARKSPAAKNAGMDSADFGGRSSLMSRYLAGNN